MQAYYVLSYLNYIQVKRSKTIILCVLFSLILRLFLQCLQRQDTVDPALINCTEINMSVCRTIFVLVDIYTSGPNVSTLRPKS